MYWTLMLGTRGVYNHPGGADDLTTLGSSAAWTIGFREISLLASTLKGDASAIIEIRPVLRRIGTSDILTRTCRNLALRCWQEWQKSEQPRLREVAYELAVESWLAEQEADDLIAILPEGDFNALVSTGSFRSVYRFPPPPVQASRHFARSKMY